MDSRKEREKMMQPIQTYEPPKELNTKNVVFWSEHYKRLQTLDIKVKTAKAIQSKARLFLKNNCIQYDPNETKYDGYGEYDGHRFICLPIKGYNSTTYRLWWNKVTNDFECSCQFNQTTKFPCSHITALWLWIKIRNWNK